MGLRASKRAIWINSLVGVVAVSLLVACGGDAGGGSTDGSNGNGEVEVPTSDEEREELARTLEGETIELIVPYDPGGSYDQVIRNLAPFLEEYTGADTVVKNMPGAGSLVAMGSVANAPERSPQLVAANVLGILGPELAEAPGVALSADDFLWVGNTSLEPEMLIVAEGSGLNSIEDLAAQAESSGEPVTFAATGPDNFYVNAKVIGEVFDFPVEVVSGFDGAAGVYQAVIQGDADAAMGSLTSAKAVMGSGDGKAIALFGELPESAPEEMHGFIEGVPNAADLAQEQGMSEETEAILQTHLDMLALSRPLAAPPSTPDDRLAAFRAAYELIFNDPDFIEAAKKMQLSVGYMPGEEVASTFQDLLGAGDSYRALLEAAYQ